MLRIESLKIDDYILDEIESRHGLPLEDVEEKPVYQRSAMSGEAGGLYKLFSQTAVGRYVLVVLVNLATGCCKMATTRETRDSERRLYGKTTGVDNMADIDKEVERIEEGNAWDESDAVMDVKVKKRLDKVIPVRLAADK